ncbi:MAG: helix-turn-helix transcriptional regulator [Gemmatimonadaceae bacterium]
MPVAGLSRRFFDTTRGQIVALLRRGSQTVDELAELVGLTDNAVRSHLSTLERDGLVRQDGVRRVDGPGKPATLYEIHPDAEALLSRAYVPVLGALLDELAAQMASERSAELMQAVGRRLAAGVPRPRAEDALEVRVRAGAALLNSLGGDTQVEQRGGALSIRGCGCPLSAATARRPEVCRAVESLLSEVVGAPVRETCDRGDRPQCCFQIGSAA